MPRRRPVQVRAPRTLTACPKSVEAIAVAITAIDRARGFGEQPDQMVRTVAAYFGFRVEKAQ